MTVVPETVSNLAENVQFLYELGFNQFLFGPADGVIWEEDAVKTYSEQMKILFSLYKKEKEKGGAIRINVFDDIRDKTFFEKKDFWGCRAGRHSFTVNPEGDIYPCSKMYANPKLRSTCKIGSLRQGITDPFLRLRLTGMLPTKRKHCSTCPHANSCAGGCFAANFQRSGSIFEPNSECVFTALHARLASDLAKKDI